jgi:EAL domain-containing protein (putative c-di-GMP-specific phosphodiesterase class I)
VAKIFTNATQEAGLSIAPHRLLGFAFAGADLLIEIGASDQITFAVGAAAILAGEAERALMGRSWRDFVDPNDQGLIEALFLSAQDRTRQGPVVARLATKGAETPRAFSLRACRLPQNDGAISCALTRAAPQAVGGGVGGLHDKESFEALSKGLFETARATGEELELAFIEMEGLDALAKGLPAADERALQLRLAGALRAQSHGGGAAARLSDERFALVRAAGEPPEAISANLAKLMGLVSQSGDVKFSARAVALKGDISPNQIVRAMRYALDDFIQGGMAASTPLTLEDAVTQSVRHTLEKASALGSTVAQRKFTLVYQPVVALKDGALHHHEVLVRFGDDASPFPMIRMAEELDLIEALDMAIAEQAVAELVADPKLRLAVNVSGRTIISPSFAPCMKALVGGKKALKGRLMFEITESSAIEDLALADRHIQALRALECMVCLDDFGAGAASLAYLQQLSLDVVKIDGRYIRELQHGGRESTFIRHLVSMCEELKVRTLAEMVETAATEDAVRRAGVDFAQGYLYGAATARPGPALSRSAPVAARRVGMVESWG